MASRVLAAADVHHALRAARPHRPALPLGSAAAVLREEVRAGRLDGDAVNAVLAAAGHRVRRSGGLARRTDAPARSRCSSSWRGACPTREIAAALSVSRKTVSTHLEHIYTKLGVSTRTQAALFAMRHGLAADATS